MELQKQNELISDSIYRWKLNYEKSIIDKHNEKTVENYINVLNQFEKFLSIESEIDRNIKLKEIDHKILNKYFIFRDSHQKQETGNILKTTTKRNDKKILILFFNYMEDENIEGITFNIKWKKLELGKVERKEIDYYSDDAIEKLFKFIEKKLKKERNEFAYMLSFSLKLCLYGGLRATEVCILELKNFGEIYVSKTSKKKVIPLTIKGKGNTSFTNPIPYEYIKNEFNFYKRLKKDNEKIFLSFKGEPLNRYHLYRYLESIAKQIGLSKNSIHSLRRTFATRLAENSTELHTIKELMRHTDIKTTSIYTARSNKRMEDAISKL